MQDALTLVFDVTAVAAVAYLSTEFCLGLTERASHPKPATAPLPAASSAAATVTPNPIATAPAAAPIAAAPIAAAPIAAATPAPLPGVVQPLPNLSAVPKAEPEYVPLEPVRPIARPNSASPRSADD